MPDRPPGFGLIPQSVRRRVKGWLRPYAARFFEAYAPRAVPVMPPDVQAPNFHRFTAEMLDSPFLEGKYIPMHPGAKSYMVPRDTPDLTGSPDCIPIPPKELWIAGYGETPDVYLGVGKSNIDRMRGLLAAGGRDITAGQRILDFGCAGGPMLRCLKQFMDVCELWGCDIAHDHVAWCEQNFPKQYKWLGTTTFPHLPFEDHYFDLIYAGSVFSHMSTMVDAWLLELARVMRPGGTLYITVVTKEAMHRYLRDWADLGFSQDVREMFTEEQIHSDFVTAVLHRSPWQHAIFDTEFFRRKCERMFDVVSITPDIYSFQWAFVLSRRDTRRNEGEQERAADGAHVRARPAVSRASVAASKP